MNALNANFASLSETLTQPGYMLFLEAVSVAGSTVIIFVTSKIPFVKKYVYMIK